MADPKQDEPLADEPQLPTHESNLDLGREGLPTGEVHEPSDAEVKARGRRNLAIALAVVGFVVLVYLTTFFRLAENLSAGSVS